MSHNGFHIERQQDGTFLVQAESVDGKIIITLALSDARDQSGGRLADDEATAHGTMRYLLDHQDAADLPARVEIGDVLTAYHDAIDTIACERDQQQT